MRGDLSRPVITDAEPLHLTFHVLDILFGPVTRLNATLDRGLLRRLTKTVPANRMQHVEPAQALVPGQRVAYRVVAHVAHVQKARRVRQHLERVELRPRIVSFARFEGFGLSPTLLPFLFDFFRKVFFVHHSQTLRLIAFEIPN